MLVVRTSSCLIVSRRNQRSILAKEQKRRRRRRGGGEAEREKKKVEAVIVDGAGTVTKKNCSFHISRMITHVFRKGTFWSRLQAIFFLANGKLTYAVQAMVTRKSRRKISVVLLSGESVSSSYPQAWNGLWKLSILWIMSFPSNGF